MALEGIARQKRRKSAPPRRTRSEGRRGPDKRGIENITKDLSGCRDVLFNPTWLMAKADWAFHAPA
jgi:hypothetical protein